MRSLLRTRNDSQRTEKTHIAAVARFARHFGRSPEQIGREQIEEYQIWLRDRQHVSASLLNQTICAIKFSTRKSSDGLWFWIGPHEEYERILYMQ
jgi:hypothetical protein